MKKTITFSDVQLYATSKGISYADAKEVLFKSSKGAVEASKGKKVDKE